MLATFAFDVCHDVYRSAREVIDTKIPTLSLESSGKYTWHPDRLPRLSEYVADFARAGERALGDATGAQKRAGRTNDRRANGNPSDDSGMVNTRIGSIVSERTKGRQVEACPTGSFKPSRMAMFRVYYLGGAEYHSARRHLGISELTWADWAEEIRTCVGRELTRTGVFPPSKYFREPSAKAS